ncbi:16955_t:CDS:2 [Funneliformis caledonium]|uniref:16955_t:CDS:1 n=1 Tax=Funneliformis caledonium TaxID=1117310 RepID=A0A9N9CKT8_9GLOM|nr:16955_t:CDS:2 [Funneliformis caledonium]
MNRAMLMRRKDFIFTEAVARDAFPNFDLKSWISKMLSHEQNRANALEELNMAWKFMFPNDNVVYVSLTALNFFPEFARSQVFVAMDDYKECVDLYDEPMYMRIFLAFHNQIIEYENVSRKVLKRRHKEIMDEQDSIIIRKGQELLEVINKGRLVLDENCKRDKIIKKIIIEEIITKPKKVQNLIFTLEFANNEIPYIDLATWAVQMHSDDKTIRDFAHDILDEAFDLRFSDSIENFKAMSGLEDYETIVPKYERNLPLKTFRKIIDSYHARMSELKQCQI